MALAPSTLDSETSLPPAAGEGRGVRSLTREPGPLGEVRDLVLERCSVRETFDGIVSRAQQLAELALASIPAIVSLELDDNTCVVTMAVPRAKTLADLEGHAVSWPVCAALGAQLADALADLHAHTTALVLGGVQPSEVLLSADGVVVLRDALRIVPGDPAAQSEDVAALGQFLLGWLGATEAPAHLRRVLENAASPSPSERPSARRLGDDLHRLTGAPASVMLSEWMSTRPRAASSHATRSPSGEAVTAPPRADSSSVRPLPSAPPANLDASADELPDMVLGEIERALSQPPPEMPSAPPPPAPVQASRPPSVVPPAPARNSERPASQHPGAKLSENERDELLADLDDFLAETPTLPGSEESPGGAAALAAPAEGDDFDDEEIELELDEEIPDTGRTSQAPIARVSLSQISKRPAPPPPPPPQALRPSSPGDKKLESASQRPGMYMYVPDEEK